MKRRKFYRNNRGQTSNGLLQAIMNALGGATGGAGGGATQTGVSAYLQNLQNQQSGSNATTGSVANQFNAGQQGIQGQLGGDYQNYLAGNVPTSFTDPQIAQQSFNQQFQQYTAPQLAAQYGAGSPQIAAQQAQGQENLAANMYQSGLSNYNNALGSAAGYGTTALGANQTGTGASQQQGTQNLQGGQVSGVGSILSLLLGLI